MMKKIGPVRLAFSMLLSAVLLHVNGQQVKWKESNLDETIRIVNNNGGQTLGYSTASGIKILSVDGFAFKDLNRNGRLDKYEDWRLPVDIRAKDLASQMSVEQIAGLMLYSRHQAVPARSQGLGTGTYNGKPFSESGAKPSDLSDQQIKFLSKDNLRYILVTTLQSPVMLDIISGAAEPSGLLPVQFPAVMKTVELQQEDVPHDMQPYRDSEGHLYDFGYGLNWKGMISDARTAKYKKKK